MKKKIIFILIILSLLAAIGTLYLNKVYLPTKIKNLIISALEEQAQEKVLLESLNFNLFKGLVLKNLVIYEGDREIIKIKEASCAFLLPAFFKRQIIIPSLTLQAPEIFLERKKDLHFNLEELFSQKSAVSKPPEFTFYISRIKIRNASVVFKDNSLDEPFFKDIDKVDLNLYLSLPASLKFSLAAPGLSAKGEYKILKQEWWANIFIRNFSPQEFSAYYKKSGFNIRQGQLDSTINLQAKEGLVMMELKASAKELSLAKDALSGVFNAEGKAKIRYNLADKQLLFSGDALADNCRLEGLDFLDTVTEIRGNLSFDNSGITSQKLSANILGVWTEAKFKLFDYQNPFFEAEITAHPDISYLEQILKERLDFSFAGSISGKSKLTLNLKTDPAWPGALTIGGILDLTAGTLKLEKLADPFTAIRGRIIFAKDALEWQELNLIYRDLALKTDGTLHNFKSPVVQFSLSSKNLFIEAGFSVLDKLVTLTKCEGSYLNSKISASGNINIQDFSAPALDLFSDLEINLADLPAFFPKFAKQWKKIRPLGLVKGQLDFKGKPNDLKSCFINAKFSSPAVSLYGLKGGNLYFDYNQVAGIAEVPLLNLSLYGGTLCAAAKMNWGSQNLPFWVDTYMKGIKIEEFKYDLGAKDKEISGSIEAQAKLNGFFNQPASLNGAGRIDISRGNLWQINFFQGLGKVLFVKDFANIVFNQGSCSFLIRDNSISSEDIKLKSNMVNLSGSAKIGFNNSLTASLNAEMVSDGVPLSGTFKDITTAIVGSGGRFGVIKVSGTLSEPKYKFKPAIENIIKGIADTIFSH